MSLIADGLMIVAGLTAGLYCMVLSRRLRRLSDSGQGIGAQIKALSEAIAETRTAVGEARSTADDTASRLARDIRKAERTLADLNAALAAAKEAGPARGPAVQVETDFLSPPDGLSPRRRDEQDAPDPFSEFDTVIDEAGGEDDPSLGALDAGAAAAIESHAPEIESKIESVRAGFDDSEFDPEFDTEFGGEAGGRIEVSDAGPSTVPVPPAALAADGVLRVERLSL